jgi:integrase
MDQACDEWLAGRRGIRQVTMEGYHNDLKPVRLHLGGRKIQALTKADGDSLVEWMLTEGRRSPKHHRAGSLMSRVVELISQHPGGITAAAIKAKFPDQDVHTCLSGLKRAGRIAQPRRAVYIPVADTVSDVTDRGLKPVTVRSTLTTFRMVVQSFVDQGVLPRNVIALVERPADPVPSGETDEETAKSWTVAEVDQFRNAVSGERLFACWLLSCYGLRRSEVLGLRWSQFDGETLLVRRSRVAVGSEIVEGLPKSRRSRRDLPLPPALAEALRVLRTRQRAEALALGVSWSEEGLIAVHEDGEPVRHDWYTNEFQRLRQRADLRRICLKGLRNTSVSLMLASGIPVHIVAAWHGHDPAVSLSIYSDAQADDLRAAGEALFGRDSAK